MSKAHRRTTLLSIGRDMNVSPATVSKALRGSPEISAKMRQSIREYASKKKFKPRFVSRKVINICLLIQQYANHPLDFGPFLSGVMEGVAEFVQEEGLEMSIYADNVDKLNRSDIVRELSKRAIDGVIILCSNNESLYFKQLKEQYFPYCTLLSCPDQYADHAISVNNVEFGKIATQHLIDRGHRQIGVLVSPPHGVSGMDRLKGYRLALVEAGIQENPLLLKYEPSNLTGLQFGSECIRELVNDNPQMTAVFAMDHAVAIGLLHGLREIGICVPNDLSVISCDNYAETAYIHPPLTVVDIPNRRLGYIAARQVYRQIRELTPLSVEDQVNLKGTLIVRESTSVVAGQTPVKSRTD